MTDTLRAVRLQDRGERLPYKVGDRVQVRYTRRVDRADAGYNYVVDPLYADQVCKWWPIYDDVGRQTVGYGVITHIFGDCEDVYRPSKATCNVKLDQVQR